MRILIHLSTLAIALSLIACSQQAPQPEQQQMAPPEVDVVQPLTKSITIWDEFTGRFEPVNSVILRSRVSGFLVEKNFKDGDIVEKGQTLFVIDPRPFEFEVKRTDAQFKLATNEFNRADNLLNTRAISREDFERRQQELVVAEAALENAKLNLEFTNIKAPFSGRVSDSFIDIGNLVQANQDVLSTIVSLNPIHFAMEASQIEILRYIRLDQTGEREGARTNRILTYVKLQDEESFLHAGFIDFVDNVVDVDTGTLRARAIIDNSDMIITPGFFGRARISGSGNRPFILLPERTINTDQDRKFVYTVNADNQAQRTYVQVGKLLDNKFVVIESGLSGDEQVVVAGVQRIRAPNQPVSPNKVELEWVESNVMPDPATLKMPVALDETPAETAGN
ncbi:efflux RND transporter periplasmic adaptor subunit [Ningiella sp. W23]|uniref:efflux RND transporter periplasmic adaptor subunit n=1 Tax=Ningiella sp. W23 TaxID=3023715 RepID=UPI0037580924